MKLVIQIPCYNEEQTLAQTLKNLPRTMPGFSEVQWLIIDDGSTDQTALVAKQNGVEHVVGFNKNRGLAKAFMAGLEAALELGADVIVNTDADNQYNAADIPKLLEPILQKKADIVVGVRPITKIEHFSWLKKKLQRLGSFVVRFASKTKVEDVTSGFRAMTRDAAMKLNVFNNYTYTLETLIQAGQKGLLIESVPISVNEELRPSRLMKNMFSYIIRSLVIIVRVFVIYKPFRSFFVLGSGIFLLGMSLGVRYLIFYFNGAGVGHLQSLILAAILLIMGFQVILIAFMADLLAVNRRLLEDIKYSLRKK